MRRLRSIEKITADIFSNLKSDIRSKMAIGDLFREAKEVIGGDKEFGKWRSAIFAGQIKQRDAHNCMRISLCFSDGIPPKVPLSGLYILASVHNEDYREDALNILAGMEKVGVKDVEAAIATAKSMEAAVPDVTLDAFLAKAKKKA